MPYGNGTGPGGMGPRTGRGFGYCTDFSYPGYVFGPGFGRGRGRGFGRRWTAEPAFAAVPSAFYYGPNEVTSDQERQILENQINQMQKNIDNLKKKLTELKKEG